jgi:glycosyltransferase involved in cell wall biosynthesis
VERIVTPPEHEERIPRVTVVLPTRNRARQLSESVGSVLGQSVTDLELIVIDDASTDDSAEVISTIADARVRYVRLEQSGGAQRARNRGIELARGSIVAFQDSDDRWVPGHLDVLIDALAGMPGAVAAYGVLACEVAGRRTVIPGPGDPVRAGDLSQVLLRYNLVSLPSSLVRADALREVGGFDERLPRYQDWELFLRLAPTGPIAFVDQIVTEAGVTGQRISDNDGAEVDALSQILRKYALRFREAPTLEVAHRAHLARMNVSMGHPFVAARELAPILRTPGHAIRWTWSRVRGCPSPLDRSRSSSAA